MKKLFIVPIMVTIAVLITTLFASYPVHAYDDIFDYDYSSDTYDDIWDYGNDDYDDIFDYDYSSKSSDSSKSSSSKGLGGILGSKMSIYDILDELVQDVGTFFFMIGLIVSLIWCFFGFKVFKIYIGICGFFIGGLLGCIIGELLSEKIGGIAYVFILICAIVGAIVAYKLYTLGVFFTGLLAMLVVGGIITYAISESLKASIIVGLILGAVLGSILVIFNKPAIIISTGVQYGLSAGVFLACIIAHTRLSGLLGIIIAVFGIMFQIKNNNGLFERQAQANTTL